MEIDPAKGLLDPKVFATIEPNDIIQGQLADCWFLCAVSSLAERPALVERIFVTKEYNEQGIYQLRICKNGEWHTVTVDDFFPCFPNGGPIFSRSNGNELWVLLLEKAYAKIHGGYKTLTGGLPYQAMMDLTGCPTMSLNFQDPKVKELTHSGKLWHLIKHFDDEGYIMTGGTPGETMWSNYVPEQKDAKSSLVPGHAYSIIAAKEAKGHKLLQIRNPWGNFEWEGDWSDNSPLWTKDIVDIVKPNFDAADGTFWMAFKDFVDNFESLDVCRVRNWEEVRIRGRFVRFSDSENQTLDFALSKWVYALDVPRKTHLVVTLHQEDERIEGVLPRRPYLDVGLAVLKMDKDQGSSLVIHKDYQHERSVELELVLEQGQYLVVPRTSGCNLRRPPSAEPEEIRLIDTVGYLHPLFLATIADVFNKFDLVISHTIDFKEFKAFLELIGKTVKDEVQFKNEVLSKFNSHDSGITLRGFRDWWRAQLLQEGEATVWTWLEKLGYDRDLYSLRSRLFCINFHSRILEVGGGSVEVRVRDAVLTDIDNRTTEMVLEKVGHKEDQGENYEIVTYFSQAAQIYTYGIRNTGSVPIEAMLDLSASDNVLLSSKGLIVRKTVKPAEVEVMMHVQVGGGDCAKVVKHSARELPTKK